MSNRITKQLVVAAIVAMTCVGILAEPSPATAPAQPLQAVGGDNRIVAQMLAARYERSPSIALFDGGLEPGPMQRLVSGVAMGEWKSVATELASLPPDDAARVHLKIVSSLLDAAARPQQGSTAILPAAEVIDLADALPQTAPFSTAHQIQVGKLLGKALSESAVPEEIVSRFRTGSGRIGGESADRRLQSAAILAAAGQAAVAWEFFGDGHAAIQSGDPALAELYVRTLNTLRTSDNQPKPTREQLIDSINLLGGVAETQGAGVRRPYMGHAISIASSAAAPELMDIWLQWALTQPAIARDLLLVLSASHGDNSEVSWLRRMNRLAVQRHIVETWIKTGGGSKEYPAAFFDLLVENFLTEAALGDAPPVPPRGPNPQRAQNENPPRGPEAIPAGNLLEVAPSDAWRGHLSPAMACQVKLRLVNLQLRADRIDDAVALLAAPPRLPADLAAAAGDGVFRAWTKINSRSLEKVLGGATRMIALTISDSARQRHLSELRQMAGKLRSVDPAMVPVDSLVQAFTNSQGRAAAISQQDVESVFGPLAEMDSATALKLSESLRRGMQQSLAVLKNKGPGSSTETPEYRSGFQLIEKILKPQASKSWRTMLSLATLQFEHAEYCREFAKDVTAWLDSRQAAFESFKLAADRFAAENKEDASRGSDPSLFAQWFICAMGETDSSQLGGESVSEPRQLPLLRQAVQSLPVAMQSEVARSLSAHASRVRAEAAQLVASAALLVVGDVPGAEPLVQANAYYQDILRDLKLISTIDGDGNVGVGKPFGVKVVLQFSEQLDREVDGFSRLVFAGQNPRMPASGVPQPSGLKGRINYRERFETYFRTALGEKFEVMSFLWSDGKSQAPVEGAPGWQQFPLAYVLLKAKDASVDLLPAAEVAMDFGDRNAAEAVILAVNSAPLPLNAGEASERPYTPLDITQTLNDRESAEGKISLEINVKGTGLVPTIDRILNLADLGDYEAAQVTDQGLVADRFPPVSGENQTALGDQVQTQRTWMILLKPKSSAANASVFRFPTLFSTGTEPQKLTPKLLRYEQTDIVSAEQQVTIRGSGFVPRRSGWLWAAIAGGAALVVLAWVMVRLRRMRQQPVPTDLPLPSQLTLISAIGHLRKIRENVAERLSVETLEELDSDARQLQLIYSDRKLDPPSPAQLAELVRRWGKISTKENFQKSK